MMASPTGRGLALGGVEVHPQAGRGVDLDDAAALLVQRAADVLRRPRRRRRCRARRSGRRARPSRRCRGAPSSVTSVAVPPVDRLALSRSSTTWPGGGHALPGEALLVEGQLGGVVHRMRVRARAVAVRRGAGRRSPSYQVADVVPAVADDLGGPALRRRRPACRSPPAGGNPRPAGSCSTMTLAVSTRARARRRCVLAPRW